MQAIAGEDIPATPPAGKVIFADDEARALLADRIQELSHPNGPAWQVVKRNDSRTVYRGQVNGQTIYLKHFHERSAIRRLAGRLRSSKARCELEHAQYLRSRGIATAPPLAAACGNGVEWFATRAVAPAEPCDAWHEKLMARDTPAARQAIRQAVLAMAELVGRMHQAGLIHSDLHCGNVLVRTDGPKPRLVLTDLHRVRRRRHLSRRARSANLAQLLHDRFAFTTRTQRLRFLRRYLQVTGGPGSLRGWQLMVEDFAFRHSRRQHRKRDRRVTGNNRYFHRIRLPGGWRGRVVLASKRKLAGSQAAEAVFTVREWQDALGDVESLLGPEQGQVIKDSASSFVMRRELTVGGLKLDVHFKRARRKQGWKILLDCFRRARSIRAFALGHELLVRRIGTALPLAALQRRRGPLLLDSILITETVHGLELNQFLNRWVSRPARDRAELNEAEKRQLGHSVLRRLGRLLQDLHDHSLAHRDLKATNMIVRWDGQMSPELALIDLDGLRHRRFLSARDRFQGLMRLNVSMLECPAVNRAGRLRMLLGYLRRPGGGLIRYKPYWRELERWSALKLRQQIRARRKRQKAVRGPAP